MQEIYLLDTNIFVNPYRMYYPFDIAQGFWDQMSKAIVQDNVLIMDVVYKEIIKNEDELALWLKNIEDLNVLSRKEASIAMQYGKVLSYVQTSGFYKPQALRGWSQDDIADPWLIAAAVNQNAVIITMESGAGPISKKSPSQNAKIPDVARYFDVRCENLFYFMRHMGIKL